MNTIFSKNLKKHLEVGGKVGLLEHVVFLATDICLHTIKSGGKIMLCGNGGSAADCQHIAAELTGKFQRPRDPIGAVALTTDTSAITCIGNDFSYDMIFERQVRAIGRVGDCLIGISTSGNSKNVLEAIKCANKIGIKTIGMLGNDGGTLKNECGISIVVPDESTARVQEYHILIGHSICEGIELGLGF